MRGLRIGGHPLHPALVHFPVVFWTGAPLCDALYLAVGVPAWWERGGWCIAGGVVTALPAMATGLLDLFALPTGHPAQETAQRHLLWMASTWCLFCIELLFRPWHGMPTAGIAWLWAGVSLAGFACLLAGAIQGARLVYDFGVGRNPGLFASQESPK